MSKSTNHSCISQQTQGKLGWAVLRWKSLKGNKIERYHDIEKIQKHAWYRNLTLDEETRLFRVHSAAIPIPLLSCLN